MDVTMLLQMLLQFVGIIVSVVSAGAAVISVAFALKAIKTAEKSHATSLLTELHKLYLSDLVFMAMDTAWTLYKDVLCGEQMGEKEANEGIPISETSAKKVVDDLDTNLSKRKAVHPAFLVLGAFGDTRQSSFN